MNRKYPGIRFSLKKDSLVTLIFSISLFLVGMYFEKSKRKVVQSFHVPDGVVAIPLNAFEKSRSFAQKIQSGDIDSVGKVFFNLNGAGMMPCVIDIMGASYYKSGNQILVFFPISRISLFYLMTSQPFKKVLRLSSELDDRLLVCPSFLKVSYG